MTASAISAQMEGLDREMETALVTCIEAVGFICATIQASDSYTRGPKTQKMKAGSKAPGSPRYVWAYKKAMRQLKGVAGTADALASALDKQRGHADKGMENPVGVAGRPTKATGVQIELCASLAHAGMSPTEIARCRVIPERTFWQMLARGRTALTGPDRALFEAVYGKEER